MAKVDVVRVRRRANFGAPACLQSLLLPPSSLPVELLLVLLDSVDVPICPKSVFLRSNKHTLGSVPLPLAKPLLKRDKMNTNEGSHLASGTRTHIDYIL